MPPTLANGKICYLEIPALDVRRSAAFYQAVVGWQIRERGDGCLAFDDGVGQVSGTWVVGRPPSSAPGLLVYVMVDDVAATLDLVTANGGGGGQPIRADAPETTARFRTDPTLPIDGAQRTRSPGRATSSPHSWKGGCECSSACPEGRDAVRALP